VSESRSELVPRGDAAPPTGWLKTF